MAVHHSADQWRAWLKEFEQRDITVAQFCQSLGVSQNTFYKWRQRLKGNRAADLHELEKLVPVTVLNSELAIELPGGAVARVPNDRDALRPLIKLLLELGAQQ
jgi:transposase-like protein